MAKNKKYLYGIGAALSLLWLAACSPAQPTSAPTMDPNPLRTEVAATVLAQIAQTPSITPFPSATATEQPTATLEPTSSPSPSETPAQSSGTPDADTSNKAQWVSQSVADDTVFTPGQTFTMSWKLKNTGTSTWTAGYILRYYSGESFGAPKEILIGQEVLPGGEIEIRVDMKAPTRPGSYRSDWVMSTESRSNFKEPVFLKIVVAAPATPTQTPTP